MTRKILREGLVVVIQTLLLLLSVATWGIPAAERRSAEAGSFEQSLSAGGGQRLLPAAERLNRYFDGGQP